jgi:NADH-ubiquinone oxidoreductase chain 4
MVLAAIILKLGGYGIYRLINCMSEFAQQIKEVIMALFLVGAIITSLICLAQTDQKSLIAYSRVCHMGVMVVGALGYLQLAARGLLLVILAHGFCSSALFFLVNFNYERLGSRQILLVRGLGSANLILLVL